MNSRMLTPRSEHVRAPRAQDRIGGTVRAVRNNGKLLGYRALLPREHSIAPPHAANPKTYQEPVGDVVASPEEARSLISAELKRRRVDAQISRTLVSLSEIDARDSDAGVYAVHLTGSVLIKVGATGNMRERLKTLNTAAPARVRLVAFLSRDPLDELLFHVIFAATREHGEWFRASESLVAAIQAARKPPKPDIERAAKLAHGVLLGLAHRGLLGSNEASP